MCIRDSVTTGSRPVIPPIPGIDSPHVLLCKNWDHAIAIKEKAKTAKSAVVILSLIHILAHLGESRAHLLVDQRDIALDICHHALEPCRAAVIGRCGGYGTDGGRLVLGPFRVPHP